ncbi:MAG TPA: FAD-binding oxidoreductase [Pirellulales bacterium]|nr:FAD-binding oxidoreductase [Pirellulales bacterium]
MTDTITPEDQAALAATVRAAYEASTAVYPVGGRTSLNYGLPAARAGIELSLAKINRVVDYPARDMTITVEAGITMAALAATLAAERQRLPIDAPHADRATLGGVIATNWSGPLRLGHGTIRDNVIGISAVDGRGTPFKGGGRVVKNVAGYDFCKLLTGSMGTIGVITQVTLKVKPIPERSALVACRVNDLAHADRLLAALITSKTRPAAMELVAGTAWSDNPALEPLGAGDFGHLVVAVEGTEPEVEWQQARLVAEGREGKTEFIPLQGPTKFNSSSDNDRSPPHDLWRRLVDFPAAEAALVLKAAVPPSRTIEMIRVVQEAADCSIQAHAGNGIVIARYPTFPAGGVSRLLVGRIQPAAQNAGGSVVVLSSTLGGELTRQAVWGTTCGAGMLMEAVKREFDPNNILNSGRFVFP